MKLAVTVFAIVIWAMNPSIATSQDGSTDSLSGQNYSILAVPILGYEPETRGHIGAVGLLTFNLDDPTEYRSSVAKLKFQYTRNRQVISEVEWDVFFREERWFTSGNIHFSKYPDLYYGVGPHRSKSAEFSYQSNRFDVGLRLLRGIKKDVFAGFNTGYTRYSNFKFEEKNENFPELRESDNLYFGLSFIRDKRNSLLNATGGNYFAFDLAHNHSFNSYPSFLLDLRLYKTWYETLVFAGRFILDSRLGNPPFFNQTFQGGDEWVRGYLLGRYRDRNLTALQFEFRKHIFWRIGAAVFGGISSVTHSIDQLLMEDRKWNGGVGIRFAMDRENSVNLRLDYAIGERGNRGFYIAFGESF